MGFSDKTFLPSSLPVSYEQRIRWESFVNASGEDIPPFAVMQLQKKQGARIDSPGSGSSSDEADDFFCQFDREGKVVWSVIKCNEEGASRQDPAQFMFNGNKWVKAGTIGRGTFDLPTQVLHNGANDSLPNGKRCGPAEGVWWVLSSGSAFTCRSHDATEAAGNGSVHTVWLEAGSSRDSFHGVASGQPFGAVEAGEVVPIGSGTLGLEEGVLAGDRGLVVRHAGLYLFGFHGMLSSSEAPRGEVLQLALRKVVSSESTESSEATGWIGMRRNEVEEDEYGNDIAFSAEHVSVTGIINLERLDEIFVRNDSGYAVSVANFKFWLLKHGAYWTGDTAQSGFSFGG